MSESRIFEQEYHISRYTSACVLAYFLCFRFQSELNMFLARDEMNFVTGSSSSAGNGGNLATRRTDKVCGELMVRIDGIECNLTGIPAPSPRPMSTGKI